MSQLIFNPSLGLAAPSTSQIREAVAGDWTSAFASPDAPPLDTDPVTPAGQLIDAEVAEIEAKNAAVLYVASQFNPKNNDGIWQDAIGYIYFLTRKLDEPTVVTCQLSGSGATVPYGALVQSLSGHTLVCNRSVTIGADGVAETTFRCADTGPIEIAAHTVTKIITTTPGWDTVDNAAPGAIGRDVETRSEFEARRAASVAANSHGSASAVYGSVARLEGVLDVAVLENIGPLPVEKFGVEVPGHGITVCVYGGELEDIARVIYEKKDAGCDTGGDTQIIYIAQDVGGAPTYTYKILRPDPTSFWVRVTLGAGVTAEQEALIRSAIFEEFWGMNEKSGNSRVTLASSVYASRFYCPTLSVDSVTDVKFVHIALGDAPLDYVEYLEINADQEPVLALENIIIEVV